MLVSNLVITSVDIQRGTRDLKAVLPNMMTMEYVRVRKDTLHEIKKRLEKPTAPDLHIVAALFGMVVVVAIAGLVLVL